MCVDAASFCLLFSIYLVFCCSGCFWTSTFEQLMCRLAFWLRAGPSCTHRAGWSCSVGCAESWPCSFYVFDYFVLTDAAVSIPGHAHSATAILFYTWYVFLDGIPAFCEQKEALMSCVIFYKLHMKKHFLKKWHNVTLTIPYCSSSQAVDLVLCWEGKDLLHLVFVINKWINTEA